MMTKGAEAALDQLGRKYLPWVLISLLLAAIFLMSGCAGFGIAGSSGGVIYNHRLDSYDPQVRNYSAARGGMILELPNNPFDAPRGDVEETIGQILTGAPSGQPFPFFSENHKPDGFSSPYRLIVLLDAARSAKSEVICKGVPQPTGAEVEVMPVMMTLCVGERLMSTAHGGVTRPRDPASPALRSLLRRMAFVVMPRFDPNQDNNRRFDWLD